MEDLKILPEIVQGGYHKDERGTLSFFNGLDLLPVRRFYVIEHPDTKIVRAWQAHKIEQKWFYVIAGSFKIVIVQPDDWSHPSANLKTQEFILKSGGIHILHVPGGFANGFKALEPGARIMVFSDFTVEESSNDNFRFDKDLWYNWN